MEELRGTAENVERAVGEALTARSIAIDYYRHGGPPDLCCLEKQYQRAWLPTDVAPLPPQGYYHWVVGADCSCPAAVSTYFDMLARNLTMPPWYASGSYNVTKATFCMYNPFRRVDVRCEATFPGKVRTFYVDGKGDVKEPVDDEIWEEAFLGSCLRSIHRAPNLPCIKVLAPMSLTIEKKFIQLASKHFWKSNVLGNSTEHPQHDFAYNWMSVTMSDFFRENQRPEAAVDFFLPLAAREPALAVHVSDAFLRLQDAARAHALLDDSITASGKQFVLLLKKCEVLLAEGKITKAIAVGEEAVVESGGDVSGWLLLAEAYFKLKAVDMSLVMLNEAPIKPYKPFPQIGIPKMNVRTKAWVPSNPNMLLISRMPGDIDEYGDEFDDFLQVHHPKPEPLPGELFEGYWKRAFDLLVDIMNSIGWDELLEARARVFLMKEDVDKNADRSTHKDVQSKADKRPKDGGRSPAAANGKVAEEIQPEQGEAGAPGLDGNEKSQPKEEREAAGGEGETKEVSEQAEAAGESPAGKESEEGGQTGEEGEGGEDKGQAGAPVAVTGGNFGGEADEKAAVGAENGEDGAAAAAASSEGGDKVVGQASKQVASPTAGKQAASSLPVNGSSCAEGNEVEGEKLKSAAAGQGSRKRVCRPWLDTVFHAVYEDLKAYYAWLSEEEKFANMNPESMTEEDIEDQEVSFDEWMHRGAIARRLQNLSEAERALRAAAAMSNSAIAWDQLMQMYAEEGCLKETLVAAHEFIDCYDIYGASPVPPAPVQVRRAIFLLVSTHGLQKVRDAQDSIGVAHPVINDLFHFIVRSRVHGFAN